MSGLMPSAEERELRRVLNYLYLEAPESVVDDIKRRTESALTARAAAERAAILAMLAEAVGDGNSELAERLATAFNSGPAHTPIIERLKRWARALADAIEARAREAAP